jgi:hypothetical protein
MLNGAGAVGRSGNELVSEVEPSQRVHRRHFEGVAQVKIGKETRNTLGEHGFADTRRAVEEHAAIRATLTVTGCVEEDRNPQYSRCRSRY